MTPGRRLAATVAASVLAATVLLGTGGTGRVTDDGVPGSTGARLLVAEQPVLAPAPTTLLPGLGLRLPAAPDEQAVTEEALEDATTDLAADLDDLGAKVSVGVLDARTGLRLVSDGARYRTASVVKVDVLVALLLRQRGRLTPAQRALAADMIRVSDNDATTALIADAGGERGIEAVNRRLGLTDTDVEGFLWGSTRTTVADQLRVLETVFSPGSSLPYRPRRSVARLMGQVVEEQRIGVSAAADDPDDAALKAGYVPRDGDGRWDVGSIGRIRVDGRVLLVAVLSRGSGSFEAGVERIEGAARLGVRAMGRVVEAAADLESPRPSA